LGYACGEEIMKEISVVGGKRKEKKKEKYPKERMWGCQLRKMGRKKENKKRRHVVGLGG
jgi:hypothetical protein